MTNIAFNGVECRLLPLTSHRWLTTIRSGSGPPGDFKDERGKRVNVLGLDTHPFYYKETDPLHKRTWMAESNDAGHTWNNFRQLTTLIGDTPGDFVRLRDGRLVFTYSHRYPPAAGVYARISEDEGRTWRSELLALRTQKQGGYPSTTVLKDGTIVTLCGMSEVGTVQAVRWRLPKAF